MGFALPPASRERRHRMLGEAPRKLSLRVEPPEAPQESTRGQLSAQTPAAGRKGGRDPFFSEEARFQGHCSAGCWDSFPPWHSGALTHLRGGLAVLPGTREGPAAPGARVASPGHLPGPLAPAGAGVLVRGGVRCRAQPLPRASSRSCSTSRLRPHNAALGWQGFS